MNCPTCGSECDHLPLAQKMRLARIERGMSQPKLADKLGFDITTIKRWEYGMYAPSLRSAQVIKLWLSRQN